MVVLDDDEFPHTLAHDVRADKNDKDDVAIVFKKHNLPFLRLLFVPCCASGKKQVSLSLSFLANARQSLSGARRMRTLSRESLSDYVDVLFINPK